MDSRKLLLIFVAFIAMLALCLVAVAQSPTYGLGKTPSTEEIRSWDIAISPDGKELPQGSGSAKEGSELYGQKCAACHGKSGYEGRAPQLIKADPAAAAKLPPCLSPCIRGGNVMAIHSPYAPTLWDYINRGMPFGKEGSLKSDEVYAITAFLLAKNGIIPEDQVVDAKSLPQIKMPNHDGYVLPDYKPRSPRSFAKLP